MAISGLVAGGIGAARPSIGAFFGKPTAVNDDAQKVSSDFISKDVGSKKEKNNLSSEVTRPRETLGSFINKYQNTEPGFYGKAGEILRSKDDPDESGSAASRFMKNAFSSVQSSVQSSVKSAVQSAGDYVKGTASSAVNTATKIGAGIQAARQRRLTEQTPTAPTAPTKAQDANPIRTVLRNAFGIQEPTEQEDIDADEKQAANVSKLTNPNQIGYAVSSAGSALTDIADETGISSRIQDGIDNAKMIGSAIGDTASSAGSAIGDTASSAASSVRASIKVAADRRREQNAEYQRQRQGVSTTETTTNKFLIAGEETKEGSPLSDKQMSTLDMVVGTSPENAKNYPAWVIKQYNKQKAERAKVTTPPAATLTTPTAPDAGTSGADSGTPMKVSDIPPSAPPPDVPAEGNTASAETGAVGTPTAVAPPSANPYGDLSGVKLPAGAPTGTPTPAQGAEAADAGGSRGGSEAGGTGESSADTGQATGAPAANPAPPSVPADLEPPTQENQDNTPIVMNNNSSSSSGSVSGGEADKVSGQNLPMNAQNASLTEYFAKQNISYQ
jgi:hypothetical protein